MSEMGMESEAPLKGRREGGGPGERGRGKGKKGKDPQRENGEQGAWSPQGRGLSPFPEAAGVGVTGVEGSSQPQAQGQEKKGA